MKNDKLFKPNEPLLWEMAIISLAATHTRQQAYDLLYKYRLILNRNDFEEFTKEVETYILEKEEIC